MNDKARRDLILEAADRLLRHYGPQKTTMADVAREVNIGVGTVYLDFPSKEALVEELSRRHYGTVLESMRWALAESVSHAAADRLVKMLEARALAFLAMADAGTHACDLLHCGGDALRPSRNSYLAEERALLTEVLREGARTGELDIDDLETTLRTVLLAYTPFAAPMIFKTERKQVGTDLEGMHHLVLRGLLRRGSIAEGAKGRTSGRAPAPSAPPARRESSAPPAQRGSSAPPARRESSVPGKRKRPGS